MKKILFIIIALCMTVSTFASEYSSMQFNTSDGGFQLIPLEGLDIKFSDGYLRATQGLRFVEIPLADLVSMQFSSEPADVESLLFDNLNQVNVFNYDAIFLGTFSSLQEIESTLPKGIYIIKNSTGKSLKLNLR